MTEWPPVKGGEIKRWIFSEHFFLLLRKCQARLPLPWREPHHPFPLPWREPHQAFPLPWRGPHQTFPLPWREGLGEGGIRENKWLPF